MKIFKKLTIVSFFLAFVFRVSVTPASASFIPNCSNFSIPVLPTVSSSSFDVSYTGTSADGEQRLTMLFESEALPSQSPSFKANEQTTRSFSFTLSQIQNQDGKVSLLVAPAGPQSTRYCSLSLHYNADTGEITSGTIGTNSPPQPFDLCNQAGPEESAQRDACVKCFDKGQIWTGVGCIPFTTQTGMVKALITLGLSITGTIVVLMTLYAGFLFSTSQGDPKRVDEAKSAMTSAIVGAFFIIFSVTILNFIGVTVLHLPSFG